MPAARCPTALDGEGGPEGAERLSTGSVKEIQIARQCTKTSYHKKSPEGIPSDSVPARGSQGAIFDQLASTPVIQLSGGGHHTYDDQKLVFGWCPRSILNQSILGPTDTALRLSIAFHPEKAGCPKIRFTSLVYITVSLCEESSAF